MDRLELKSITLHAFIAVMAAAFIFGFMKVIAGVDFERLHIFLFNLSCGGFTLLYYTEGGERPGILSIMFFLVSIVFAVLVFFGVYPAAFPFAIALAVIVEILRIRRFRFFPLDFFKRNVAVSGKFHQASLLCLSIALLLSTLVILNNQYYGWLSVRKLTLNVFFLGFSFPVSLITLSVMFTFIRENVPPRIRLWEHVIFWTVNLGVIIFFIFILMELIEPEVIMAVTLAVSAAAVFFIFIKYGAERQQKFFLVSGMVFLLFTAVTGIAYIAVRRGDYGQAAGDIILSAHSYLSLYGWNLSGMLVILRRRDFPLRLNSAGAIALHWITVAVFAPLGRHFWYFSAAAVVLFVFLVAFFFNGKGNGGPRSE